MADFYTYRNEVAGRRRKRRLFLILIVVLAALCIGVGYFWFTRQSAPAQTSSAESATPEQAASAAAPTEAPSAAPADIAEPQRILPGVDTAAWDKSKPSRPRSTPSTATPITAWWPSRCWAP